MKWLKKLIRKLFGIKKVKLIEEPKVIDYKQENARNNFVATIKQTADLERDDRNGYKIIKRMKLKDMI